MENTDNMTPALRLFPRMLCVFITLGLAAAAQAQEASPTLVSGTVAAVSASVTQEASATVAEPVSSTGATTESVDGYRLGAGDRIKLTVMDEPDLSGEFEVEADGSIALPMVGAVPAAGHTLRGMQKEITAKLDGDYLVNPRVEVAVVNFRPVFVLGAVNKPGNYPYMPDMTVVKAISLAGGYAPGASSGKVSLKRRETESSVPEDTPLQPGDVIRISKGLF